MNELAPGYVVQAVVPLAASLTVLLCLTVALVVRGLRSVDSPDGTWWTSRGRYGWLVALLVVTGVFVAANQLLVRGAAAGIWDVDGQFFPYFVMVADHARAGRFTLWDPWSNGGLPAMGDPQVGAFSPIVVLVGLLMGGTSFGFTVYWLLTWWLGGLGVLLFARHLGAPAWGAAVVAMGFLFCGVYTGNAEHTSWLVAYSFLPLVVWRLDAALRSRTLRPAMEAGALWGLSALAGHPSVVIITGGYCALWALGRGLLGPTVPASATPAGAGVPSLRKSLGRALVALILMSGVGLIVLAPTYVAFFVEAAGTNPRVGALPRADALSDELQPGAVATFASPYLTALKEYRRELWPASDVSMVNLYAGAIVPALALFGLLRRRGVPWRWWVAGLGLLCLVTAMGETLPVRGWLYDWLLPMRYFRHSAVFRLFFLFSLCVLALEASRDLEAGCDPAARRSLHAGTFLAAAVLTASAAILGFAPFIGSAWNASVPRHAEVAGYVHFAMVWLGLLAVGVAFQRLAPALRSRLVPVVLLGLAGTDALLTSALSIPTVLRIGGVARWRHLDARHRTSLDLGATGLLRLPSACPAQPTTERCRLNDQLIDKIPVLDAYAPEKNPYQIAMVADEILRRAATGVRRVWFSSQSALVAPTAGNFAAFVSRAEGLGSPPLLVHTPEALQRRPLRSPAAAPDDPAAPLIGRMPPAQPIDVRLLGYSPVDLRFDAEVPGDGWLLVTDRWGRSWQATVNGRPTVVHGGNFIFRAVPVSSGRNRVEFTFTPFGFPWLLALSWAVLSATAASAGLARGRAGRRDRGGGATERGDPGRG